MLILGIIICTLFCALFSGTEIAFISANRVGIEIEKNKKSTRARILNVFYNHPKEFIGVILVGLNIALIALTYFFSQLLDPIFNQYFSNYYIILFVKTLIITLFVLVVAEFIPKALFKAYSNEAILKFSYILYFFYIILKAPTMLLTSISTFLLRNLFRTKVTDDQIPLTRVDLEHYIEENLTEEHDVEKNMFQKALNLNQIKARDVMIPRTEIVSVDGSATSKELIAIFESSKHSRLIVTDDDIENVIGYIHHQQLLTSSFKYAREIVMPISFITETTNAKDLLLQFIREKQNICIVVDEYGSVAGIITMEDLSEEIFGEIEDEYDQVEDVEFEKKISEHEFVFSGRLEIDYLNEKYEQLDLPLGDYNTLSGLIVTKLGSIPKRGTEMELNGYLYRILKMSRNKIDLIKLRKISDDNSEERESKNSDLH